MNREAENGWRVGDLAVCISDKNSWGHFNEDDTFVVDAGPSPEQVLRVVQVYSPMVFLGRLGAARFVGLRFHEFPAGIYPAPLFRKVKPDAEAADDADLVALIKGVRVGADA